MMFEKPFTLMTDAELREELDYYLGNETTEWDMLEWQRDVQIEIANILKMRANERELTRELKFQRVKFGPPDEAGTLTVVILGVSFLVMFQLMTWVYG